MGARALTGCFHIVRSETVAISAKRSVRIAVETSPGPSIVACIECVPSSAVPLVGAWLGANLSAAHR